MLLRVHLLTSWVPVKMTRAASLEDHSNGRSCEADAWGRQFQEWEAYESWQLQLHEGCSGVRVDVNVRCLQVIQHEPKVPLSLDHVVDSGCTDAGLHLHAQTPKST